MSIEVLSRETVVAIPESCGVELKEGKEHPQVVVKVRVIEGETAGREQTLFMSLHPNAAEITVKQLRALGWSGTDVTNLEGLGSVKADMTCTMGKPYTDRGGQTRQNKQYSIWAQKPRPTLRAEDQAIFAAKFKALAAGIPALTITDDIKAPATLPAANSNPAPTSNGAGSGDAADELFS